MSESIESAIIYKPIDLKALIDQPLRVLSHNGLVPRNGVGYAIDSKRYIVHLDLRAGEFWVTYMHDEESVPEMVGVMHDGTTVPLMTRSCE